MTYLYQWATLDGSNSMASFAELTAEGYTVCGASLRFASLLMRKRIDDAPTTEVSC